MSLILEPVSPGDYRASSTTPYSGRKLRGLRFYFLHVSCVCVYHTCRSACTPMNINAGMGMCESMSATCGLSWVNMEKCGHGRVRKICGFCGSDLWDWAASGV